MYYVINYNLQLFLDIDSSAYFTIDPLAKIVELVESKANIWTYLGNDKIWTDWSHNNLHYPNNNKIIRNNRIFHFSVHVLLEICYRT